MRLSKIILIFSIIACQSIIAQTDTTDSIIPPPDESSSEEVGYLIVKCDSSGSNIFVDDMLLGQSPIETPIPLPPGKHTVTYFSPEYLLVLKMYNKEKEIKDLLSSGYQTIYVTPGKTITVHLWWKPYKQRLETRKRRFLVKSGIGIVLIATLLTLSVMSMN